eukprot:3048257-Pleurochrysis_carterae.AAC.2
MTDCALMRAQAPAPQPREAPAADSAQSGPTRPTLRSPDRKKTCLPRRHPGEGEKRRERR